MTAGGRDAGGPWPDRAELARWEQALASAADRLQVERGLTDAWRLTAEWGGLWAEYGDRRVCVAGSHPDVSDPEQLFEEIDEWAAFHRRGGPGHVLERDRRAMAAWREQLPAVRRFWESVAARVLRDVETTTGLDLGWRVTVHEDEEEWSAPGPVAVGGVVVDGSPPVRPRRPLPFPEVWLETAHSGRGLPPMEDGEEAACHLADAVQDDVIEGLHGAWPPCPRHPHPLRADVTGSGVAVWVCPQLPELSVPVGSLGGPAAPHEA